MQPLLAIPEMLAAVAGQPIAGRIIHAFIGIAVYDVVIASRY